MHDYSPDALMTLHQFTLKQRLMMEENPKLLPIIGKGAWLAIGECQRQFKDERWNCTNYSSESVLGKILNIGKHIWVKVFKNVPNKICGRQPLENLKLMVCCLPQILLGPYLNTLTPM